MDLALGASARTIIGQIHASPAKAVIVESGAGSGALAWLMGVPGASRTVLEGVIPYSRLSLVSFLGYDPDQYVSSKTCQDMAQAAYTRALDLREGQEHVVGLACTATIATDRPKRGDHRAWVCLRDDNGSTTYALKLTKDARNRMQEEELVSWLILKALAEAWVPTAEVQLDLVPEDNLEVEYTSFEDPIKLLIPEGPSRGDLWVMVRQDGCVEVGSAAPPAALSGSFDPFHVGHDELAKTASAFLGSPVVLELSVTNVDKPPIKEEEVRKRIEQFRGSWDVALTCAPTFVQKAGLFRGCTFIIGYDTALRLVHPRYYDNSEQAMYYALEQIRSAGCRFLVAGREYEGHFRTLADVDIPDRFTDLFQELPESRFRQDISSTVLQAGQ